MISAMFKKIRLKIQYSRLWSRPVGLPLPSVTSIDADGSYKKSLSKTTTDVSGDWELISVSSLHNPESYITGQYP
jgi:hypothetical protein